MTVNAHLASRLEVVAGGPCWLFSGAINSKGYGCLGDRLAHRIAYEDANGPIPEGMQIDHLCRNRTCCNPAHLEPVTLQENMRRRGAIRTECPQGHPYDEANTRVNARGHRSCRECQKRWRRESDKRRYVPASDLLDVA
jgi:hypothetical protein